MPPIILHMTHLSARAALSRLADRPYLLLTIAPLLWAGNIVLARGIITLVPPIALAFWRWTLATALVLPFAWRHMRPDWPRVRAHLPIVLLLALLGVSAFNTLLYTAVQTTTAINGALMQASMPAWVILFGLLLFRDRVTWAQLGGVLLAIAGAAVIVLRGDLRALVSLNLVQGDLLILLAIALYALYSLLLRKQPGLQSLSLVGWTFVFGVILLLPFYAWELGRGLSFRPTAPVLVSILYVALGPSILAYLCWNRGVQLVGANRAGLFINLTPAFAALLSVAFLGEQLQIFHLIGFACILGGMYSFNRQPRPPSAVR